MSEIATIKQFKIGPLRLPLLKPYNSKFCNHYPGNAFLHIVTVATKYKCMKRIDIIIIFTLLSICASSRESFAVIHQYFKFIMLKYTYKVHATYRITIIDINKIHSPPECLKCIKGLVFFKFKTVGTAQIV